MSECDMPEFTPEEWKKWLKDKKYAEERMEKLEGDLDEMFDEQERLTRLNEELKADCDREKRLRAEANSDASRAKAAADQAAAAAAAATRSLKLGAKQTSNNDGGRNGDAQELRVEVQELKSKNHGLRSQVDALSVDHERILGLLSTVEQEKTAVDKEASDLRCLIHGLEEEKARISTELQEKETGWESLIRERDASREDANRLDAQNRRLGDELDRIAAGKSCENISKTKDHHVSAELDAATKAHQEAEEQLTMTKLQLLDLQRELTAAREEATALQDAAELKADAMREGLAAADAQTAAAKAEVNTLREELAALKVEQEVRSSVSVEDELKEQALKMMARVKEAEDAKEQALKQLADAAEQAVMVRGQQLANGHSCNGERGVEQTKDLDGENNTEMEARLAALQEELHDMHAMLDNVSSERDVALNDLRLAGEGGSIRREGGHESSTVEPNEKIEMLRRENDDLMTKVNKLEIEKDDELCADERRVKALEAQVERLSHEHTRQSEVLRGLTAQMESEKGELQEHLIAAKLQVAQLSMEVDGLKLRHRQETVAAAAEHAEALQQASPTLSHESISTSGSSTDGSSISSASVTPLTSPQSMEL